MLHTILDFFSINKVFFTVLDYQMSYIEFFGTLFNLWCVWLVARKHILNWPIGIIGSILFGILFYQIRLYADFFEQIYFFVTGLMGWYAWSVSKRPKDEKELIIVSRLKNNQLLSWGAGIVAISAIGAWAMAHIHIWLPRLFPDPASYVVLDVATTVISFAATILMIKRYLDCWYLWIAIDIIGIGLYWLKGVPFIALLYAVFLVLATMGLIDWRRTHEKEQAS